MTVAPPPDYAPSVMATPSSTANIDGVDVPRVTAWFEEHVDGARGPLDFVLIAGGRSNLTFKVTDADGRRYVLRRPPLGHVLATAHDMGREHRIISALAPTPVPVAPALGYCDDPDVNGAPFYVMAFVDGLILRDTPSAQSLDEVALTWGARITRIELCQVVLPEEVSEAMTELAAAQRHRIAVLVEEQAALEIEAVRAEGEHQARLRRAEVRQALLLMEAERKAEAIRILADAERYREQSRARGQADAIRIVSNAVPPPGLPRETGLPAVRPEPSRSS